MIISDCHKRACLGRSLSLASLYLLLALITSYLLLQNDSTVISFATTSIDFDQVSGWIEDKTDSASQLPSILVSVLFTWNALLAGKEIASLRPQQAFSLRLIRAPPLRVA